jgi:hypothetical protein
MKRNEIVTSFLAVILARISIHWPDSKFFVVKTKPYTHERKPANQWRGLEYLTLRDKGFIDNQYIAVPVVAVRISIEKE